KVNVAWRQDTADRSRILVIPGSVVFFDKVNGVLFRRYPGLPRGRSYHCQADQKGNNVGFHKTPKCFPCYRRGSRKSAIAIQPCDVRLSLSIRVCSRAFAAAAMESLTRVTRMPGRDSAAVRARGRSA